MIWLNTLLHDDALLKFPTHKADWKPKTMDPAGTVRNGGVVMLVQKLTASIPLWIYRSYGCVRIICYIISM